MTKTLDEVAATHNKNNLESLKNELLALRYKYAEDLKNSKKSEREKSLLLNRASKRVVVLEGHVKTMKRLGKTMVNEDIWGSAASAKEDRLQTRLRALLGIIKDIPLEFDGIDEGNSGD